MFINCPYCNALVATDPATDAPPERCPRCASLLRRPPEMVAEFHVTALPPSPEDPQAGTQASLLGDGDGRAVDGADVAAVGGGVPAVDVPAVEMPAVEVPAVPVPAVEVPAIETPAVEDIALATPPSATPPAAKMHVRYVFRTAPVIQPTPAAPVPAPRIDAAPVDAASIDSEPLASAPVDSAPVDIASVDIAPVDIASVDIAPVDIAPGDAAPIDPAPPVDVQPGLPAHPVPALHIPAVQVPPVDAAQVAAGMAQAAAEQQVLDDAGPNRSRRAGRPTPVGGPVPATAPSFVRRRTGAGRARWPGWRTTAALGGLSLLLLLQLLLADRDGLAADPRWRPAMATLCGALGCSLPAWHEPSAMTLLARDVRPHARMPGVLRVSASFRNDARWAQPWPELQLTLADVDGRSAGARTFAPREYLGAPPTQPLLAPGQVATIAMDVVEPAPRSVAFTFDFH